MAPAVRGTKMSRKGLKSMRHRRQEAIGRMTQVLRQLMKSRPVSKRR